MFNDAHEFDLPAQEQDQTVDNALRDEPVGAGAADLTNLMTLYLRDVRRFRPLDAQRETILVARMNAGSETARDLLICHHLGLVIAYSTFSLPFALWLLIAYFETIPHEIDEAARVDGAAHFQVFTRIILPLAAPGIATASIFAFLGAWNEFTLGLVLIQQNELKTVPVGLALFLQGGPGDTIEWGARMAAGVMVIVPSLVFFLVSSGRIARGLAAGAVKG